MSQGAAHASFRALIKTHHITSRKKVARLKQAATSEEVYALLRSGGSPGIMYVEGSRRSVEKWVAVVQVGKLVLLTARLAMLILYGSGRDSVTKISSWPLDLLKSPSKVQLHARDLASSLVFPRPAP